MATRSRALAVRTQEGGDLPCAGEPPGMDARLFVCSFSSLTFVIGFAWIGAVTAVGAENGRFAQSFHSEDTFALWINDPHQE